MSSGGRWQTVHGQPGRFGGSRKSGFQQLRRSFPERQ
jgi:hypothetical protein